VAPLLHEGGRLELEGDPDAPDGDEGGDEGGGAGGGDEGDGAGGGDEGDGAGGGDEGDSGEELPDDPLAERAAEALASGWDDLLEEMLKKMDEGPPAEAAAPTPLAEKHVGGDRWWL